MLSSSGGPVWQAQAKKRLFPELRMLFEILNISKPYVSAAVQPIKQWGSFSALRWLVFNEIPSKKTSARCISSNLPHLLQNADIGTAFDYSHSKLPTQLKKLWVFCGSLLRASGGDPFCLPFYTRALIRNTLPLQHFVKKLRGMVFPHSGRKISVPRFLRPGRLTWPLLFRFLVRNSCC